MANLAQQLKNLKAKPEAGALPKGRGNLMCASLMAKIDGDLKSNPASYYLPKLWFLRGFGLRNCFQYAVVTCLVFVVGIGGCLTAVSASFNSLPGDTLYTIKLATEKVQLALAQDDAMKINLHTEFAARRIDEMKTIVQSPFKDKDKESRIELALANVKTEINSVNDSITSNGVSEDVATGTIKFIDQKINELNDIIILNAPKLSDKIKGAADEISGALIDLPTVATGTDNNAEKPASPDASQGGSVVSSSSPYIPVFPENKEVPEAPKKIQFQIIIEE
jgi:hypothetical protein